MTDNYTKIVQDNLNRLYTNLPEGITSDIPCERDGEFFIFEVFGEKSVIEPDKITLGEDVHSSIMPLFK